MSLSANEVRRFTDRGCLGPVPVLRPEDCRAFLTRVRDPSLPPPADWAKGHAVTSHAFYELATHPLLLDPISRLLGGHVILWGASLVVRVPGAVHPWHTDIESSAPDGKTVSVWMGLEHTSRRSSLKLVPGSHRFGITLQEVASQHHLRRATITDEHIAAWSRERHGDRIEVPAATDGQALFFDGRLWHGSHNRDEQNTRCAVLLQYASPDTPIRIPDLAQLEWPLRQFDEPRPPCLLLRGEATSHANRIAPPPSRPQARPRITSQTHAWPRDLMPAQPRGWTPHIYMDGATADLDFMGCHTSALAPTRSPHPPHRHEDEEILIMLEGEADLLWPDRAATSNETTVRIRPGEFAFYPSQFAHTLTAIGPAPARYLMFKWRGTADHGSATLSAGLFATRSDAPTQAMPGGLGVSALLEGATRHLRRLHAHVSTLAPGGGYEPHFDAHHVGLVVLEGRVETLGATLGPHDSAVYAAGEPHGLRNAGDQTARYLVIEFHSRTEAPPAPTRGLRGLKAHLARAWRHARLP